MSEDKKQPQMMDPGAAEGSVSEIKREPRNCWALATLVEEVRDLFPEIGYEIDGVDGRNTAHDVTFDLTTLDTDLRTPVTDLLRLVRDDERVSQVLEDEEQVRVLIWWRTRTQDSRESFGLADAWMILNGEDES